MREPLPYFLDFHFWKSGERRKEAAAAEVRLLIHGVRSYVGVKKLVSLRGCRKDPRCQIHYRYMVSSSCLAAGGSPGYVCMYVCVYVSLF